MIPESECKTPVKPKRTVRKQIRVQKEEMPPNQLAIDDMYDIVSVEDSYSSPVFDESKTYTRNDIPLSSQPLYIPQLPTVDIGESKFDQLIEPTPDDSLLVSQPLDEDDPNFTIPATPEGRPSKVIPNAPQRKRHHEVVSPIQLPPPFRSKYTSNSITKRPRNLGLNDYQERCYQYLLEKLTDKDVNKLRSHVIDGSICAPDEFTDLYLPVEYFKLFGDHFWNHFKSFRAPEHLTPRRSGDIDYILPSTIRTRQFVHFIGVTLHPFQFDNQIEFNTAADILHVSTLLQAPQVYNRAERFILANATHITQLDLMKCLTNAVKMNKANRALIIRCIEVMLYDDTKDTSSDEKMLLYLRSSHCSIHLKAALCELYLTKDRAHAPESFSIEDDANTFESYNQDRILCALKSCQVMEHI
jgi:hypothetical protein